MARIPPACHAFLVLPAVAAAEAPPPGSSVRPVSEDTVYTVTGCLADGMPDAPQRLTVKSFHPTANKCR